MANEKAKKKILSYSWTPWLERLFGAFILSLFKNSTTLDYYQAIGIKAWPKAFLFEQSRWYRSEKIYGDFAKQLGLYVAAGGSIFKVSRACERFYKVNKKKISKVVASQKDPVAKLGEIYELISPVTNYIWLAHGLEDVYAPRLQREAPKYIKGDIDKFIGDISFPIKKNAHARMEDALRSNTKLETIVEQYGWLKNRDILDAPFTVAEMKAQRAKLAKEKSVSPHKKIIIPKIIIPKELRALAKASQELVYFRTLRTDIFYEFLFLARPVFKAAAQKYGIPLEVLKNYSIPDLLNGRPKLYPPLVTAVGLAGSLTFFNKPILPHAKLQSQEVKGQIAYAGVVRGIVRIVKSVKDLDKLKEGDILVTQMTFPSFIMAMRRVAAFVTDEGGITCHAAIVAREMNKPCIIGTKIATKIFKDGDRVEVDADKGIVRKI